MALEHSTLLSLPEFFRQYSFTVLGLLEATNWGDKPGPALCRHGCAVDLRGACDHGCPSALLTLLQYGYDWGDAELGTALRR